MDLSLSKPKPLTPVRAVLWLLGALSLLAVVFVPVPEVLCNQYMLALLDFFHFAIAAGACWLLWARFGWSRGSAFAVVVVAAALCEIVQSYTGRHPSVVDFFRGVLGASAMLMCLSAFQPPSRPARWIGGTAVAMVVSAWPVGEFLAAAARFCVRVLA